MMSSLRKSAKPIMVIVAVIFVISCLFAYGGGRRRNVQAVASGDDVGAEFLRDYDVAVVNGERIRLSRLEFEIAQFIRAMGLEASATSADLPAFRNTIIDRLATLQELDKEILARNVVVAKEEVDEAISEIEDQFPTKEIYLQQLQANGITEAELRSSIEDNLKRGKVFEEVMGVVSTDEDELRNFYEMMKTYAFQKPEGFLMDVAHFLTEDAAEAARSELESGKDWDDVIEAVSPDVSDHSRSDNRIFIPSAQLTDEVEFIKDLSMDTPSRVVTFTSDDHMIVVKRVKEEAGTASFDEVRDDLEEMIVSQKRASQQSQFMQELLARATVEILDEELFTMISNDEPEDETIDGEDVLPPSAPQETATSEGESAEPADAEQSAETIEPEETPEEGE